MNMTKFFTTGLVAAVVGVVGFAESAFAEAKVGVFGGYSRFTTRSIDLPNAKESDVSKNERAKEHTKNFAELNKALGEFALPAEGYSVADFDSKVKAATGEAKKANLNLDALMSANKGLTEALVAFETAQTVQTYGKSLNVAAPEVAQIVAAQAPEGVDITKNLGDKTVNLFAKANAVLGVNNKYALADVEYRYASAADKLNAGKALDEAVANAKTKLVEAKGVYAEKLAQLQKACEFDEKSEDNLEAINTIEGDKPYKNTGFGGLKIGYDFKVSDAVWLGAEVYGQKYFHKETKDSDKCMEISTIASLEDATVDVNPRYAFGAGVVASFAITPAFLASVGGGVQWTSYDIKDISGGYEAGRIKFEDGRLAWAPYAEVSFSYLITPSIALSLGGKYVFKKNILKDDDYEDSKIKCDEIQGIVGLTYHFQTGER